MDQASVAEAVLVSEADAAPKLRELRAFSAARRERLGAAISAMLLPWRNAWDWRGLRRDPEILQVEVRDTSDSVYAAWNPKWMACGPAYAGASLLRIRFRAGDIEEASPEFPVTHLAAWLWGAADERQLPEPAPAPGSMAMEIARAMWQDFWQRWCLACAPQSDAVGTLPDMAGRTVDWPRPDEFSGVLLVEFCAAGLRCTVALEAASVDAILAKAGEESPAAAQKPFRQADRVRVDDALRQRTLALDAYLLPCTISLGALQNLRVGDVIALEHPLDQPSQVFSESREKVAHAWMTQTNGFKSLELAASPR